MSARRRGVKEPPRQASHDRYVCHDCAAQPPRGDYMVHAAVWSRAGMPRRGFLCLTCLDDRLVAAGHGHLKLADFTDAPCNAAVRFGYAMTGRQLDGEKIHVSTRKLEDVFTGTIELAASELACLRNAVTELYMSGGWCPEGENRRDFTRRVLAKLGALQLERMVTPDGSRLVSVEEHAAIVAASSPRTDQQPG